MCEYCSIDDKELLKLPAGEEGFCEYCADEEAEESSLCGRETRYATKFRYMDEHLCEGHMQEQAEELKEGLMEFQESLGLSTGVAIKKIEPGEVCEHASLPDLTECGKPAGYALINTALFYVCDEHKDKE